MDTGIESEMLDIPEDPFTIPRGRYTLLGVSSIKVSLPATIGTVLAILIIFNRLYWRLRMTYTLSLDDYLMFLAMVSLVAFSSVFLTAVGHGYGHPSNQINPLDLRIAVMMIYLTQSLYLTTVYLTKLSILALYVRIFRAKWSRWACKGLFIIITMYAVAAITFTILQCLPVASVWDLYVFFTFYQDREQYGYEIPELGDWSCIDRSSSWLSAAIFNTTTDFIILALLPFMIWTLQGSRIKKIGLTAIFGVGIFAFAAGILRLSTLVEATKGQSLDPMIDTVKSSMWTIIEACLGSICACLPMLRTFLQQVIPSVFDRSLRTRSASHHDSIPMTEFPKPQIQIISSHASLPGGALRGKGRRSSSLGGLLENAEEHRMPRTPSKARTVRERIGTFNYAKYQKKNTGKDGSRTPEALPRSPSVESFETF